MISSLSDTGLVVLTVKRAADGVDVSGLAQSQGEERAVRLTAQVGAREFVIDAQLVWSEALGSDEVELIVDATSATTWPAVVAAYHEVQ